MQVPHGSLSHESQQAYVFSEGKRAVYAFKLGKRHHVNRVPGAALQESAIGTFAGAKFAPNAEQGINDNAPERGMVLVRGPKHAISNRAVLDASRGSRAPRAGLIDDGKNVGFAFALGRRAAGNRRVLDDSSCLIFLDAGSGIRHANPPGIGVTTFILADTIRLVNGTVLRSYRHSSPGSDSRAVPPKTAFHAVSLILSSGRSGRVRAPRNRRSGR